MFKIITKHRLEYLEGMVEDYLEFLAEEKSEEPTLNCGYKSCNFQTTSPRGLKLHRTKIHKKK